MASTRQDVVRDWHDAVNSGEPDKVRRLVVPNVSMSGPRGTVDGVDTLVDWISHAGIQLQLVGLVEHGAALVAEERATWPDDPDAGTVTAPVTVGTVFTFDGPLIASIRRYPSVADAVAAIET